MFTAPRFAVLGPGRLGSTLARALCATGRTLGAVCGGGDGGAALADALGVPLVSPEALPDAAEVIFATVPDGQLGRATGPLRLGPRHALVHCSGALDLRVLAGAAGRGTVVGCMHPLQSFPTRQLGIEQFAGVHVGIEAPPALEALLRALAVDLGAHALSLQGVDRACYHAAAVLASNAVIGLHGAAAEAWELAGLPVEHARGALSPLTLGAAEAVGRLPLAEALTGPVARGDVATVRAHLTALCPRPRLSALYRSLSRRMLATGMPTDAGRRAQLQALLGGQPDGAGDAPASAVDEDFMRIAMAEADTAGAGGDVPVGCVLVREGKIIARGNNRREAERDPLGHAELSALRAAARAGGDWRLAGVTAYVTLEPCPMCAGALVHSRVERVVYGCHDPKAGALRSLYRMGEDPRLNHRFAVTAGVLGDACSAQLSDFFARVRGAGHDGEPVA